MPEVVSKDNPRTLRRVRDGATVRVTNQLEYVSLTSAHGYRDVTDEVRAQSAAGSPTSTSDVPPQSATKDVWVEHAVSRGADRATAEAMSKSDLIATYGA